MNYLFEHHILKVDFSNSDPVYYADQIKLLRNIYQETSLITQADLDRWGQSDDPQGILGKEKHQNPTYPKDDPIKALTLYKDFTAYEYFLTLVTVFLEKNLNKWNIRGVKFELERMEKFIESTEKIVPSEAFQRRDYPSNPQEYVKLRDGYYEVNVLSQVNSHAVYSEYFLLYELFKFKMNESTKSVYENSENKKVYAAKYYALLHWILISLGKEKIFEKNENDQLPKGKIIETAKLKYSGVSPQGFYQAFKEIDLTNKKAITNEFGNDFKSIIINLSNHNPLVIDYVDKFGS